MLDLNITGLVNKMIKGELSPEDQKVLGIITRALIYKGAEADKYKWHDLRKNPEDLPEYETEVLIKVMYKGKTYTTVGERLTDYWSGDFDVYDGWKYEDIIAWMPIPKFEEE